MTECRTRGCKGTPRPSTYLPGVFKGREGGRHRWMFCAECGAHWPKEERVKA